MTHTPTTMPADEFNAPTRELTTEEIEAGYLPAVRCEEFNPMRTEFRWSADFAAFLPVRLRWWDAASYAAYQAGDDAHEFEHPTAPEPSCGFPFGVCNMPDAPASATDVPETGADCAGPSCDATDDDDAAFIVAVEAEQREENVAPEGRCPPVVALCDDNAIPF